MKILALHSRYQTRAGEDESFDTEVALLRARGHEVHEYVRHGAELEDRNPVARGVSAVWNGDSAGAVAELVRQNRPDVAYVNNVFPGLTASVLSALARERVPVLMAVRNYRLSCIRGVLFRDDRPCVDCLGRRLPLPGIGHACYRDSKAASVAATGALLATRAVLDRHPATVSFAAVSAHVRDFLVRLGVPRERIGLKPNTVAQTPELVTESERYLLFVGRLQPEKGVRVALQAVADVHAARLLVVGSGPLEDEVRAAGDRVEFLGERPHHEVLGLLARARAAIVPSTWDEPFGRVAMEALGCGTPVIVSSRGGLAEIPDRDSGLVVDPGDRMGMARAVSAVLTDRRWAGSARRAARARFDAEFSPDAVATQLERLLVNATGVRHLPAPTKEKTWT